MKQNVLEYLVEVCNLKSTRIESYSVASVLLQLNTIAMLILKS